MRQISSATVRWTASLAVLVLWEALPRLGLVPELFLPPLSRTVFVLATNWQEYAEALGVTLVEVCAAGAIACFDEALADIGLPDGSPLRQSLHDSSAWATHGPMARHPHSKDDVPEGLRIPRWSWDGPMS